MSDSPTLVPYKGDQVNDYPEMENDMVMIGSMNSTLTSLDMLDDASLVDDRKDSNNSDDDTIAVLYKGGNEPNFMEDNKLTSLSVVCSLDGPPLEQREDIIQTKRIPERLKEELNFNCEEKVCEVEDQMKARENIDQDMENEIENIKKVEANKQIEDVMLMEAAKCTREKAIEVRKVAQDGHTTLKRAMEIFEVALPPFLTACEKSFERNDLSEEVEKESQEYETCLAEKRKAGLNFDLGIEKSIEANQHLEKCIQKAKEDEENMSHKQKTENEFQRMKVFTDAKKEMDDIIKGELDEVHNCLKYCKGDLQVLGSVSDEQEKRFHSASRSFEMGQKTLNTKIDVNRKNQEDLRAKLRQLEEQDRALVERRKFEQQVQEKAQEWNNTVTSQLKDLTMSIKKIQVCASTSLKVMELMKDGGTCLIGAAIKAEEQYLSHLKDLDLEAKTKWRNAMATSAVEKRLKLSNLVTNVEEYKEKYKCLKKDLNKAVQRQKRIEVEDLKKEMKRYNNEMEREEKERVTVETELNVLMEQINRIDENLLQLGRAVETVDTLYAWRAQEEEDNNNNGEYSSIEFSQDEDSD